MRHVFPGLRTVPVPRLCRNERDGPGHEVVALAVDLDDAVALGHEKDLVGGVDMPAVARTVHEMHFRKSKVGTVLAADGGERLDVADEDVGLTLCPGLGIDLHQTHENRYKHT